MKPGFHVAIRPVGHAKHQDDCSRDEELHVYLDWLGCGREVWRGVFQIRECPHVRARNPHNHHQKSLNHGEHPQRISVSNQKGLRPRKGRISFFDPANQPTTGRLPATNTKAVMEDANAKGTMANVEEMLEGYEWTAVRGRGAADQIEARLLKQLTALDAANMYSLVESGDRVAIVLKYIKEVVKELDEMEALVQSYKTHLKSVAGDISYIQGRKLWI